MLSRLNETDDFGDRMKEYEAVETSRRFDPALPIYARIDGRSFSRFTRDMDRPFDARMTDAMVETTKHLVHETHARIGYVQSDEVSLIWQAGTPESDVIFSGKVQKMVSVLASMAAAKFATVIPQEYADRLPHFDCRVIQMPSQIEAANMLLWRAMDARKNAISMVAHSEFPPKALHRKDQRAMLAMLVEKGIDFDAIPERYRRGVFVRRKSVERELTSDELARIPEAYRPDGLVVRTEMQCLKMPPFNEVANRVAVVFDSADPA